jgi:hypothetical protein
VRSTDSFVLWRAYLLIMLAASFDVYDWLDRSVQGGATRYLIVTVPIVAAIWIRMRQPGFLVRRPMPSDVALFALFVFGLGGSLIGVAFFGTVENARPIFLPMSIPFLYLLTTEDPTDREVSTALSWLSIIATAYTAMNALVNLGVPPGLVEFRQYRNASVAMVALAVATAIVLGKRRRLLLVLALSAVIFVTYPSATSVLVAASVVLTFYLTGRRSSGLRTLLVSLTIVTVAALALVNFDRGIQLTDRYFAAVDKANANSGRLDLRLRIRGRGDRGPLPRPARAAVPQRLRAVPRERRPRRAGAARHLVRAHRAHADPPLPGVRAGGRHAARGIAPSDPCVPERLRGRDGVQSRAARRVALGHDLRPLRDRDVAGRASAAPAARAERRAGNGQRTRGAIRLNAARFRRWARAQ